MNHHTKPFFKEGEIKRTAIFDIDGTLTHDTPDELSGRVYWHMYRQNLLTPDDGASHRLLKLRDQYLTDPTDQAHRIYLNNLNEAFDRQVIVNSPSTIRRIAHHALADTLVYPALMQEVAYWHEQEVPIIVASGSPRVILDPIMQQVDARIGIGTQYARKGNHFHPFKPCESRGTGKEQYLTSVLSSLALATMDPDTRTQLTFQGHWPKLHEIPEDERVYVDTGYGNSVGDTGIFNLAKNKVVVNPRGNLKVHAAVNQWRTIITSEADQSTFSPVA